MAESVDHAPANPSSAKRSCFQTFKKAYLEKWLFLIIEEKGDTCVDSEVHCSVVKSESVREVQNVDCPVIFP